MKQKITDISVEEMVTLQNALDIYYQYNIEKEVNYVRVVGRWSDYYHLEAARAKQAAKDIRMDLGL